MFKYKEEIKLEKKNMIIASLVVVIMVMAVLSLLTPEPAEESPIAKPGQGTIVEGEIPNMSNEEIKQYLKQKQDATMFTIQVNSESYIEKGSTKLELAVANPEKNSLDAYIEIVDDDEVLFTSPIMNPNQYLETAELSRTIEEDKSIIVRYNVVYEGNIVGVVEAEINVKVK